jgi:hypothetical protein
MVVPEESDKDIKEEHKVEETKSKVSEKKGKKSVTFMEEQNITHLEENDNNAEKEEEEEEDYDEEDGNSSSRPSDDGEANALGYFDLSTLKEDLENYR